MPYTPEPCDDGKGYFSFAEVETFNVNATFGSSALTSYGGRALTFARTNTGELTLTLPQGYKYLCGFSWGFVDVSGPPLSLVIKSQTLSTDGKIVFESRVAAGTATDPASGDQLLLEVKVSRADQNRGYFRTV